MSRTVTVALIVGTLLTLINQGDGIVSGELDLAIALKILANYLIPWCVSSIGYISARRATAGQVGGSPDRPSAEEPTATNPGGGTQEDAPI